MGGFAIITAGIVSRSRYAFLGSVRTGIMVISYEIFFNLICLHTVVLSSSINFMSMITLQSRVWFIFIIAPLSVLAFFLILLESGRAPFDLAEAESELVAGYNVEYGGILFALFYLAEYFHI